MWTSPEVGSRVPPPTMGARPCSAGSTTGSAWVGQAITSPDDNHAGPCSCRSAGRHANSRPDELGRRPTGAAHVVDDLGTHGSTPSVGSVNSGPDPGGPDCAGRMFSGAASRRAGPPCAARPPGAPVPRRCWSDAGRVDQATDLRGRLLIAQHGHHARTGGRGPLRASRPNSSPKRRRGHDDW